MFRIILIGIALILILSGCTQTKVVYPTLPEYITEECKDTSQANIKYNKDLVNKIIALKGDLAECSAKQRALVGVLTPPD